MNFNKWRSQFLSARACRIKFGMFRKWQRCDVLWQRIENKIQVKDKHQPEGQCPLFWNMEQLMNWKQKLFTDSNQIKRSQIAFLTNAPLGNQYMLQNFPRRKPELKRRPGGGKLGYDQSSFLNLNKYCSLRLLYSWKVLASLKAWCKLSLSRFRWNVTVSRRVRGRGGKEALCYLASTGYASEQGIGFQGHCLMFVTAVSVLFLLKLQEYLQLSLLRTGRLF